MLERIKPAGLYHYDDNRIIEGANPDMSGDCSGLTGNCSGIWGNCSKLSGDLNDILERPAKLSDYVEK